jgi:hypothetical protein
MRILADTNIKKMTGFPHRYFGNVAEDSPVQSGL